MFNYHVANFLIDASEIVKLFGDFEIIISYLTWNQMKKEKTKF